MLWCSKKDMLCYTPHGTDNRLTFVHSSCLCLLYQKSHAYSSFHPRHHWGACHTLKGQRKGTSINSLLCDINNRFESTQTQCTPKAVHLVDSIWLSMWQHQILWVKLYRDNVSFERPAPLSRGNIFAGVQNSKLLTFQPHIPVIIHYTNSTQNTYKEVQLYVHLKPSLYTAVNIPESSTNWSKEISRKKTLLH